ncbi:MAG: hypothetical protein ABSD78_20165 [Acidimicrobiales bacterium]|jgi:hypothetical protein
MDVQRWFNQSQPQTLWLAQILLYTTAAFELIAGLSAGGLELLQLLLIGGQVYAAHGIANGRKLGYRIGVVFAFLPIALQLALFAVTRVFAVNIFSLLFEIALVAALLHPQSREYQRIWFK